MFPWGLQFNLWWMHALMYFVQMQYTNIYIMVNTWTCTSCINGVKTFCRQNWEKKTLIFFMACKSVTSCCDKGQKHTKVDQKQ